MTPQKIALLTDSCADLSPQLAAENQVFVVPLRILCKDGEYRDGVDIHAADIYARLRSGELPQTSLPAAQDISDAFDAIAAAGYDGVIALMLSGGLSGTYNMVRLQAGQRDDLEIAVFDSRSGSLGIGIMVLQLWEEIVAGASWETLVRERAPHLVANTFPFFSVDTLEYLRRGGRISAAAQVAGSLLKIKPILQSDEEGHIIQHSKVRGQLKAMETLAELYKEYAVDGTRTVGIAHADCPDGALRLQAKLRDAGQTGEILSVCYEPVTGGHVGPGTVALFFFGEVWR